MLRRIAELAARGRIIRRKILVGDTHLDIYVSPDAQLKYAKLSQSSFDVDLIRIAEHFVGPSDCTWDVGANVGVFTFASACRAKSGVVIGIEADIWLAGLLRRSCGLASQQGMDIRIVPVAIADRDGVLEFRIAARGRASNALSIAVGSSQMGGVREKQYVPTLRLDTLLDIMPHPDFLKIDVEGAEGFVLAGARRLIEHVRPIIYVEVAKSTYFEVQKLLKEFGYQSFDESGHVLTDEHRSNMFFAPRESQSKMRLMDEWRSLLKDCTRN